MLYLISDNSTIGKRWAEVFNHLNPLLVSSPALEFASNSIVMVLDTLLDGMAEDRIEKLFARPVMVLSTVPSFESAQRFLGMGAMGYGNVMMHESHLLSAYQALEEGKVWLHPDFIGMMISQIQQTSRPKANAHLLLESLSGREREVAVLIGDGATHQEIADALDITVRTVKAHATAIYQKLHVKDRLALSILLHS
jgi:DNA-binding NarL/FixJ family response regulator